MKTKEEIEQLAKKSAQKKYRLQHIPLEQIDEYGGEIASHVSIFSDAYTQCQEDMAKDIEYWQGEFDHLYKDMADKKYTEEDIRKTFMAGIECAVANGKNFEQYINSLNKQD